MRGPSKESSAIVGFQQAWSGDLTVLYWLFDSWYTAKKAAVAPGYPPVAAVMHWQSERNPEDVIEDATWYHIPKSQWDNHTRIVFVKNNVMVHVIADGHPSNQQQFARDVARKIEAKIEMVLNKTGIRVMDKI